MEMEKVTIEALDMKASRIGLGTWALGGWMWGGTKKNEPIKTIHRALNRGINLIDTAPVYGFGESEIVVGNALKEYGNRDEIILVTKVALEWKEGEVYRNSTKERIFKEIDDSLRRLKTDYIDIYLVHWPDPLVPFQETAEAMLTLKEQGKIRAIGVSNYSPEQMDSFREVAPIVACEPPYNLFERGIESDVLPYCQKNDIILLTYGALCRGLLSGKMIPNMDFEGDDLRNIDPKFQEPNYSQYLKAVQELDNFARKKHGKTVLQLAVRWILDQGVEIALWGARKPDQLDDVGAVMNWQLDVQDRNEIEKILNETIDEPIGPEFMAPPSREEK